MKIVTKDKAYIQRVDIAHLLKSLDGQSVPSVIIDKCFSDVFICVRSNQYDFFEFTDKEAIEFIKNWEYSVDYFEHKDKTLEEIIEYANRISDEREKIAQRYNAMSQDERTKNYKLFIKCELLEFKIWSVRDILWFRQGYLNMSLPAGINNMDENGNITEDIKQSKGITKILKRIFNKEQ